MIIFYVVTMNLHVHILRCVTLIGELFVIRPLSCNMPYSGNVWQQESLANLVICQIKPSQFYLKCITLMAESIHLQKIFPPTSFDLAICQTFLLYSKGFRGQ